MGTVIWAGGTAGAPVEADGEPEHPTITVVRRSRDMRVLLDIGNLPFISIRIAVFLTTSTVVSSAGGPSPTWRCQSAKSASTIA
jgi:hypothetical protein